VNDGHTAILLAAGQGTRIAGMTNAPKVLLDLHGRSLLARHFEAWAEAGLRRAALVVGYGQGQVREAVAALNPPLEIVWVDNEEFATKGNTHSLWLGLEAAAGAAVIFDADLIYEPGILRKFMEAPAADAILVGPSSLEDIECAKALVDGRGCVRMTIDKRAVTAEELARHEFAGEAIGVLKFDASSCEALASAAAGFLARPENVMLNWEHLLNRFLPNHDVACHHEPSDKWVEIDTPEDYAVALEKFAPNGAAG
tara:strand:+ start:193 stop:957 length:765 start_codon:yes stop_codon:yes gene_type:complete